MLSLDKSKICTWLYHDQYHIVYINYGSSHSEVINDTINLYPDNKGHSLMFGEGLCGFAKARMG